MESLYARIVIDLPHPSLDRPFDYSVPADLADKVFPGVRVTVPFGLKNKIIDGYCLSVSSCTDCPLSKLKSVASVYEDEFVLMQKLIPVVEWMRYEYHCTYLEAIRCFIPPFAKKIKSPKYVDIVTLTASKSAVSDFVASNGKRAPVMVKVLMLLMDQPELAKEDIILSTWASPQTFTSLKQKGFISIRKEEIYREADSQITPNTKRVTLSSQQIECIEAAKAEYGKKDKRPLLIRGVTGSGKTEVYMHITEYMLSLGKSVIMLIPEIALTWQSVSVFTARFGKRIAVMHSGLTDGERFDAYKRIRRGEIDIVLGTRSAIFAPLPNIGLIVIDEEQEAAYKSDMSPKYHARDIAKHRAAAHGALLLMASATPAVESYYEAQSGKYTLVKMTKRYTGADLPAVKIADMRMGRDTPDMDMVGGTLRALMQKTSEEGKQSMLFLNRRGYNSMVSCRACGETLVCPNCSVSLTHHKTKKGAKLVCHYCGYHIPPPRYCAKCGSEHLAFEGYGTQLIEEEIGKFLPEARILRMDADTTRARFSQDEITGAFGRHEADVLVGTQMIAKGHNFPDLSLVGVVAADASLFLDDFRANERTFSLITQVIGRAGRATGGGIAVIQTLNPDNETIRLSASQNYEAFYENEIALRRALVFPPFCDIAVFGFTADEETELRRFSADFITALKQIGETDFPDVKMLVFGPFEAPIFKIKNKYRMRAVIKFKNNRRARALFAAMLMEYGKKAGGKIGLSVDINPSST